MIGKTLIIPGYRGSEPGHWQRHWAFDRPGSEVVEQESFEHPVLPEWLHVLEARLAAAPGAVLVAHSLGCALVAHLAGRPSASHVGGALLVAPADVDVLARDNRDFADFAPMPRQALPFPSILVASRDDPFMRFSRAEGLADDWGSGFVDLGRAGHINVASGFGPWPEGVILSEALRGRRSFGTEASPRPAHRSGWIDPSQRAAAGKAAIDGRQDGGFGAAAG